MLLSCLFQFMKTHYKVFILVGFTEKTGLVMVIAFVSDSGDKRLLLGLL